MSHYCNTVQIEDRQATEQDYIPNYVDVLQELDNCQKIYTPEIILQMDIEKIRQEIKTKNEIPIPLGSIDLFQDFISKDGTLIGKVINNVVENIAKNNEELVLKTIDELYLVFSLAKKIHNPNTLNYEIFNEINEIVLELRESLKYKKQDSKSIAEDLRSVVEVLIQSKKDASNKGIPSIILEDTGEDIGGMKLFRLK